MSRSAAIDLTWADGDYRFALRWGELAELQEKCDAGPYVVLHRLHSHQWRIEDISNVIRLGLIGGGMSPADALKKVRTYVEARPPLENHTFALAILSAGLLGAPEEPVGEQEAPTPEAK
ncbi:MULTISPECIES: gene transfer agent family protein [unclassified Sinorhizobium]|uniref:gene transfer agent family protein n=1 Tax=unclassified Sinorhizobium TaxID=2613772 RepID=UPI003526907A